MLDPADLRIVVNYRRDDTGGHAGRLYDALSERFGDDHVFMDIDAIEPGTDFAEVIDRAVGSADAFLALIGKRWLTVKDAGGQRRLDSPEDYVRLEIEAALARKVVVIPVLLQGAAMPSSDVLPGTLSRLARIQAQEVSDSRWHYDLARLIATLEKIERQKQAEEQATVAVSAPPTESTLERDRRRVPPASERRHRSITSRRALLAGAGVACTALVALLLALFLGGDDPDPALIPNATPANPQTPSSFDGLVYARNGSIFLIDGGNPVALTAGSGLDWSPDGRRIAFAKNSNIWVMNEDGRDQAPVVQGPEIDNAPAWSREGDELFFDRKTGGDSGSDLWKTTVNGDPGDLMRVTYDGGAAPDVSGTGEIVFQQRGDILVMDDGADALNITAELPGSQSSPAWSPDGERIAFRVARAGRYDIYLMNPTGQEKINLTRGNVTGANNPTWSRDGKWIVITAADGIWITDRNGKAPEQVVSCTPASDDCQVMTSPNR